MANVIKTANQILLDDSDITEQQLQQVLNKALGSQIDEADLYLQSSCAESWFLEDGIVKEGDFSIDRGFGLRVISGEKTGFAYADNIDMQALTQAASSAKSIVYSGEQRSIQVAGAAHAPQLYPDLNPLHTITEAQKVELLTSLDQYARSLDPRVKQVMIRLAGEYDVVWLMNSEGLLTADVRPLVSLRVRVIVEQNGRREQGSAGGGGRDGYQIFLANQTSQSYADKAVQQALLNLEAVPAPAGSLPVVLGPGWPAVLLHEAVGHGLEGDFNRKGSSAFSNRIGEQVASPLCTIVDDGTIPGRRGSLSIDDEGTQSQNTVLIENGVLKTYMQDRLNAKLMGMQSTGNGRRESFAHLPLPRMTNTYMLPGESDPQEIIESVQHGIYAVDFSGGQVDITSGKFVFCASEAYLIENGKVTVPIKGASLIGNGPEVLTRVSMVGNDLQLDSGVGTCGKAGQSVPVGVGQPTLKIEQMTVGGADTK